MTRRSRSFSGVGQHVPALDLQLHALAFALILDKVPASYALPLKCPYLLLSVVCVISCAIFSDANTSAKKKMVQSSNTAVMMSTKTTYWQVLQYWVLMFIAGKKLLWLTMGKKLLVFIASTLFPLLFNILHFGGH